jgi:RHS repeat-associated protein
MALIDDVAVMPAHPHAARAMGNGNSFEYDANGNMTVRREKLDGISYAYTQTWSIDNRLIGVTKALTSGVVLAQTSYFFDGDGVRVRKDDPDGTTLYVGSTEAVIGAPGTVAIEYYDDTQSGTFSFLNYTKTVVSATTGISYAWGADPPLAGMGGAPWALRWNQWVSVTQAGLYTVTVNGDDGVAVALAGVSVIYSLSIRDTGPLTASVGVSMTPGNLYQLQVSYLNYTSTNGASFRLRWTRPDGVIEDIPAWALRARGRKDYYSFAGAVVAMKEGVTSAPRALYYLHGDHLGSISLTTDASGQKVSEQRYKPYGEVRWTSGAGMPTDFTFTSQRAGPANYVGSLMDYNARFFSPALGRFVSADTITARTYFPADFNRYAYVHGNPLGKTDPTGHIAPLVVLGILALGALIGGGVGTGVSVIEQQNEAAANGRSFDVASDLDVDRTARTAAVGVAAGVVGAGLVVAGGIAAGAALGAGASATAIAAAEAGGMAAVGAAGTVNAVGNTAGYLAAAGSLADSAKLDDAFVAASAGFVNGATNQAVFKGGHPAGSAAIGGITTAGEYAARQFVHGQSVDNGTALANFGAGAAAGFLEGVAGRPGKAGIDEAELWRNRYLRPEILRQRQQRAFGFGLFRSFTEYGSSSYAATCVSDPGHDGCPR